ALNSLICPNTKRPPPITAGLLDDCATTWPALASSVATRARRKVGRFMTVCDRNAVPQFPADSAPQDLQDFFKFQPQLLDKLLDDGGLHPALLAFQPLPGAADREALFVQERPDLTDHQHVLALVVTAVAAP